LQTIYQSQFDLVIHSSYCTIMQSTTITAPGSKSRWSKYVMYFYRRERRCNSVHVKLYLYRWGGQLWWWHIQSGPMRIPM